jgi:hypothetical protein
VDAENIVCVTMQIVERREKGKEKMVVDTMNRTLVITGSVFSD